MSAYGVKRLPSISNASGRILRASMARCMAAIDALRIFILSISSGDTKATAQANASRSMMARSESRRRSVSCFESLSSSLRKSGGKITAAAVTGPARHPRPASSHPASTIPGVKNGCSIGWSRIWVSYTFRSITNENRSLKACISLVGSNSSRMAKASSRSSYIFCSAYSMPPLSLA